MSQTAPGYRDQTAKRTMLRIAGVVLFGAGLVLTVIAFLDLFSTMGSDDMDMPKRFFLAFIGLPLMGLGGWCLQLGFLGAAAMYTAGEVAPTARDTLGYVGLTEGGLTCALRFEERPVGQVLRRLRPTAGASVRHVWQGQRRGRALLRRLRQPVGLTRGSVRPTDTITTFDTPAARVQRRGRTAESPGA